MKQNDLVTMVEGFCLLKLKKVKGEEADKVAKKTQSIISQITIEDYATLLDIINNKMQLLTEKMEAEKGVLQDTKAKLGRTCSLLSLMPSNALLEYNNLINKYEDTIKDSRNKYNEYFNEWLALGDLEIALNRDISEANIDLPTKSKKAIKKQKEEKNCSSCNNGLIQCTKCLEGQKSCNYCFGSGKSSCSGCGGAGSYWNSYKQCTETCIYCGGSGSKICTTCAGKRYFICSYCGGTGKVTCYTCGGTGIL